MSSSGEPSSSGSAFSRLASAIVSRVTSSPVLQRQRSTATAGGQQPQSSQQQQPPVQQQQQQQQVVSGQPSPSRTPSPWQQQPQATPRLEVHPPRSFLGAVPRTSSSRTSSVDSEDSSSTASNVVEKRCFCGFYTEDPNSSSSSSQQRSKKPGRCKFCRSRAKYMPGQRSFDLNKSSNNRRRERMEPRRAASEDRRSDGQSQDSSSSTTASSSFDRPASSFFLRRQDRLPDLPSPNLLTVPPFVGDHGLRTPPTPPLTHRMAHEMPEYLLPPPRTLGTLGRAHTDPSSIHPLSPPPAYSEVASQLRDPPPTYEEALSHRFMLSSSVGLRSHSEERTSSTRRLMRSQRAEDIPDIYWEQAARELDFCTCRKCQTRYRQYFEEDPDPGGDSMIPMETQVLMQEVLTDGIAFCSLM